jgi:hypothetical protein
LEVSASRPGRLTPRGKSTALHANGRGLMDPRASLNDKETRKLLFLAGFEPRSLGRPARSQSRYRLSYPGSYFTAVRMECVIYGLDDRGVGVRIPVRARLFPSPCPDRLWGQSPIQLVPGTLSTGVKRQGRVGDHSPQTNDGVKNTWILHPLPHTSSRRASYILSTGTTSTSRV